MSFNNLSSTADNIYYQITRTFEDTAVFGNRAEFQVRRVNDILKVPSDYYFTISRFSIPSQGVPFMLFKQNTFFVKMDFDGFQRVNAVNYVYPNSIQYTDPVYNIQSLLDSINDMIEITYLEIKATKPLAPPTSAPYFTFDSVSKSFTLVADTAWDSEGIPTIELSFNEQLQSLLAGFQVFSYPFNDDIYYRYIFKDNKNNVVGTDFVTMQETSSFPNWQYARKLLFESDSIPVVQELQGTQKASKKRLLTDFNIEPSVDFDNSPFTFTPSGTIRWLDLDTDYPMREIDVRVFWQDLYGDIYPIVLQKGDVFDIKLRFRHRSVVDPA